MLRPRSRLFATLAALASAAVLSVGALTPARADPPRSDAAIRALAHHRDLTTEQAAARLAEEQAAGRLGERLQQQLGSVAAAGHYVDDDGTAVVPVTTEVAADVVRAAGARPRLVQHSLVELEQVKADLDQLARDRGAGRVQSWGIDVRNNRVHVVTTAGADDDQTDRFLQAAEADPAVAVTTTSAQLVALDDLLAGQRVASGSDSCSVGFNARDAGGNPVLLSAGHCGQGYATFSSDGVEIGTTTAYTFPGSGDYAEAPITNPYWNARGAVNAREGVQAVAGAAPAAVGASICKSGRTTDWTCGVISSIDNTVNYDNGDGSTATVTGLLETTACSEGGDSGSANMSGDQAQGMTSGGAVYDDDGNPLTPPVCGEKVGRSTVSFVQPIAEPLAAYGLTLITEPGDR